LVAIFDVDEETPKLRITPLMSSSLEEEVEAEFLNPPLRAFKLSNLSLSVEGCVFIMVCFDDHPPRPKRWIR
jgi:hypothetical protein